MAGCASVFAQVPGTVQPGQIERQLQQPPRPLATPGAVAPRIPETGQTAPANAAQIRFVLQRVELSGATVYSAAALQAAWADLAGTMVSLADVYALATRLTARYRNDGWILAQVLVPAQTIEQGVVRLTVLEGTINEVRVEVANPALARNILAIADRVKAVRPVTAAALEGALLRINDLPGVTMRGVLSPAPATPGASDLLIQATSRAVGAGIAVDNRGSRSLGPQRLLLDAEVNTALGAGSRTTLRHVRAQSRELDLTALHHEQWLNAGGTRLTVGYSDSRARPENLAIIPLNLETAARTVSVGLVQPLQRSRSQNLSLRAGLAAHSGESRIFGVRDTADEVRSLRLGLTFDRADAAGGVNLVDLEASRGLSGMGASRNGDPFLSRPQGRVDYAKVNLYAARQQALIGSWSALVAFSGQYAFTRLLSSELYGFGGEQFGRGYDPSELVGDHGAALKLELRHTGSWDLAGTTSQYTAYGFYDVGQVRQRDAGGLAARTSAASVGIGLRVQVGRHLGVFGEVAQPLNRTVALEGDRKARFYGGISLRY